MATDVIHNAILDLTLIGQKATLERIQAMSGLPLDQVVNSLKNNRNLLILNSDKIRLVPGAAEHWSTS